MQERAIPGLAALAVVLLAACQDAARTTALPPAELAKSAQHAAPPSELVTVTDGGESVTFRPYTGTDFSEQRSDPVNLLFVGHADPLRIRAALFQLDGDRSGFPVPPGYPFDCTWRDAIGEEQTGYSTAGWEGSVVQLECGDYEALRFHLRLFSAGGWTIANAHLDVLIPATPNHQVLSWEVAEQLVVVDLVRSGLLAAVPPPVSQPIHEAPFRTILPPIYNGLPPGLQQLVWDPSGQNPAPPQVQQPVPILTDGRATILRLVGFVEPEPGAASQAVTIQFDRAIPKPFCNPDQAVVLVQGPVRLWQEVRVTSDGVLQRQVVVRGDLGVTPLDPGTGAPLGPTQPARIQDLTQAYLTPQARFLEFSRRQQLQMPDGLAEQLGVSLQVGPHQATRYFHDTRCAT